MRTSQTRSRRVASVVVENELEATSTARGPLTELRIEVVRGVAQMSARDRRRLEVGVGHAHVIYALGGGIVAIGRSGERCSALVGDARSVV